MTPQERDQAAYDYLKKHCPRILHLARNPYTDPIREPFPKSHADTRSREYEEPASRASDPSGRPPRRRKN